jgi:hypothetical protein
MTTYNSNIHYVPSNGWRGGHEQMTFRTKILFINVHLFPTTKIYATQLQMELTFTTRRLIIWRRSIRVYSSVSSLLLQTQ